MAKLLGSSSIVTKFMTLKNLNNISPQRAFWFFTLLVGLLASYIYLDYLLLDKLFLFKDIGSDTINASYPHLIHLADYLRTDGNPMWSFNRGMGQSIVAVGMGSPFEWPLFALGSNQLAYGIVYIEVLKIILGGGIFYLYLRQLSLNSYVCTVGGLLYAFSGYMILGGTWYIFSTEAVYLALLLYAFERYLQHGVWWPLPIAVALIAASYAFDLYTHTVLFTLYGVLRYYEHHGWNGRAISVFFLKVASLGLLGAGIAAVFLFANVEEILQSHRVSGGGSLINLLQNHSAFSLADKGANVVALMRAFSSSMTGVGSNYHGMINYLEDPLLYCGLISLLLSPQVFIFLSRRQKIIYGALALTFVLPIAFPYFRYAFWLFAGDYYRVLSLFISLVAILFALKALQNIMSSNRLNPKLLVITLVVLLVGLFYPYELTDQYAQMLINPALKLSTAVFLCLYALLIVGISQEKTRFAASTLLIIGICFELTMSASMTVNFRPVISATEFKKRSGYNDHSVELISSIKKNDPGIYRIEKTYSSGPSNHTSLNDGMVQGYWGTSAYQSLNKGSYLEFLDAMGLISDDINRAGRRWIVGLRGRPILLQFASVKYLLSKDPKLIKTYEDWGFRTIGQAGDIAAMINPFALPFGYTYDAYILRDDFMLLNQWQKDVALIKSVVLDPALEETVKGRLQRMQANSIGNNFVTQQLIADNQARHTSPLTITHFNQNNIAGKITLTQDRLLFFTIPYDKGWQATIDGKPVELQRINIGFTGLMVTSGTHTIELKFQPTYWIVGWVISGLSFLAYLVLLLRRR